MPSDRIIGGILFVSVLPACLPSFLPACLPACLPAWPGLAWPECLPALRAIYRAK
ncbi:hypothetical protein DPMN_096881 [Dreissena polymorpha]|uniref:Uncharacterized protein n=1 Tax=Dreissena polymorpha TaxID=45954 RepID=A0A9D4LAR2_DREPO|nr:hypothetical protein DPMN_096881 [Dreissena polymorpha]